MLRGDVNMARYVGIYIGRTDLWVCVGILGVGVLRPCSIHSMFARVSERDCIGSVASNEMPFGHLEPELLL